MKGFNTLGLIFLIGIFSVSYVEGGNIEITSEDKEIIIDDGAEKIFTFAPILIDKSKPRSAILSMEARVKAGGVQGYCRAMKVKVNWSLIEGPRLVNKPPVSKYGTKGLTQTWYHPATHGGNWTLPYSHNFVAPDRNETYRIVDGGTCRFEFDLTDLVSDKKMNEIVIYNRRGEKHQIVVRNIMIRYDGEVKDAAEIKSTEAVKKLEYAEGAYKVDKNTLLLMHFDENKDIVAQDSVNKEFKGEMFNINYEDNIWTKGRVGNALAFKPNGQYMTIPDRETHLFVFGEKQDFTIDFWLYADPDYSSAHQAIVFHGASSKSSPGYGIYVFKDIVIAQLSDGAGREDSRVYVCGDNPIKGDWHHIALVGDRSGVLGIPGRAYLFIDGVKQKKPVDISRHTAFIHEADLWLGFKTEDYGFSGKIDELRISDKVRTLEELNYGGYFPQF